MKDNIKFETNLYYKFQIGFPWPGVFAIIQTIIQFFNLIENKNHNNNNNQRLFGDFKLQGYDSLARGLSVVVSIMSLILGIINSVCAEFLRIQKTDENHQNNFFNCITTITLPFTHQNLFCRDSSKMFYLNF